MGARGRLIRFLVVYLVALLAVRQLHPGPVLGGIVVSSILGAGLLGALGARLRR
jgi:ABC-type transporter Mla maintaining outer membrane lipid asymmetry permease subunit MlaE